MSTTNTNFSTLIAAIDTKAQSLASSTTDAKDLVYLGKAIEALNIPDTVSGIIDEGDTQTARVTTEGTTQVGNIQAAAASYAQLAGATFTGAISGTDLTLSGNLTVSGTTTSINSTTLDVADLNITIADGAADAAAANGAGLTIDGANATFIYNSTNDEFQLNKPLAINGSTAATIFAPSVITTNATAVANTTHYYLNASAITLTLPASPSEGDIVKITEVGGNSDCIVGRNGSNIMSDASDLNLNQAYAVIYLQYVNATIGWAFA